MMFRFFFLIKTLSCLHDAVSDRQAKHFIHVSQYIRGEKKASCHKHHFTMLHLLALCHW